MEIPRLPVAADWFSLTWVTARTAVLTEPHIDDLLRANLWYLRGRERDLLVDTGNGVSTLAPLLARLARGRRREVVCAVTHAHLDGQPFGRDRLREPPRSTCESAAAERRRRAHGASLPATRVPPRPAS